MKRLPSLRIVATIFVAAGLILALSAFILPYLGDGAPRQEREIEILITDDEPIAGFIVMDDLGHFIGEFFILRIHVQYYGDTVALKTDSFFEARFTPFERTGRHEKILQRTLDSNVSELIYEVEIRSIEGKPGKAYIPNAIAFEYVIISSGSVQTFFIPFEQPMHVGTYYGFSRNGDLPLRPLKGSFEEDGVNPTLLWWASALFAAAFVALATGGLVGFVAHRRVTSPSHDRRGEVRRVRILIEQYRDRSWLGQKSSRERLIELGESSTSLVSYFFDDVSPESFWRKQDNHCHALVVALERAYEREDPAWEQIEEACTLLETLFVDILAGNRTMRRVVAATGKLAHRNEEGR